MSPRATPEVAVPEFNSSPLLRPKHNIVFFPFSVAFNSAKTKSL